MSMSTAQEEITTKRVSVLEQRHTDDLFRVRELKKTLKDVGEVLHRDHTGPAVFTECKNPTCLDITNAVNEVFTFPANSTRV